MKRIGEKRRLRNLVAAVSVGLIAGAFSILPVTEARGGVELPVLDAKGAAVTIEPTSEPGWDISSTADNNIIKWVSFSIGSGGKVAFDSHNYLNYVTGHARSDILGTLTGGGSIYIVNPNGILIGDGAQVDVGSLYLSTRNLTTEQLAGFDTATAALFKTDSLSGDVINMGKLNANVISVEGNNITFKNTADVTKDAALDNAGQLTGGTVNQSVNLWADGGEIHIGSAGGSASGYTVNNGTEIDYRLVKNVADLQNMSGDGNYMLATDISSATINPINYHTGRFDGLNHTLSNLTINLGNYGYGGLFRMNDGTIENLEINGITFTNAECDFNGIGAFVGFNDTGTIKNVRNTGSMVFSIDRKVNTIGGIVGINNPNGTIENIYNTAEISYGNINSNLGGIAGSNHGKIVNTFNSGRLDAGNARFVGGIAGSNYSTIENAYNIGDVMGNQNAGGIAGSNGGTLSYTYNTGTVNGSEPESVDFTDWTIDKDGTNETAAWRQYGNNAPILKAFLTRKDNYLGEVVYNGAETGDVGTNYYTPTLTSTQEQGIDWASDVAIVTPKTLTVNFADISKTYDGTTNATAGTGNLDGVEAIDTGKVSVTANAAYADKNVGTGKQVDYTNVALTGDKAGNYTIAGTATGNGTITAKNITVSFADISKTYDGTTNATAGAGTLDGVEAVDTGQVSVTASAAYADKNAGTNKQVEYTNLTLGGDEAGNYTIAAAATGTGVITPKAITATFADISKTYDGTTSATAGAGTLEGVEAVDTGKVSVTANAAYADKNAGTGKQVDYSNVALTGTESGNYSIADTATGKGQINRANLTVSVKDYSREYDGTTSASGAELQVTSGTLYAGDTISGGTKVFDTKDVGTGKTITVSEVTVKDSTGNANNYNISYAANTNSAITPKTLTVNFADISKTYDGTTDAVAGEGTLQGVVAGEDVTLQDGIAAVYDSKNAGNRTVNYSGIAISGADIGNYTIAATGTGTGVINPKELTASFADVSKTYDGTITAMAGEGTLTGVENVDTGKVSVTASAAYADKNAGTNKQVDYTNVALTGTEAGNYTIANTAIGKGQINRANLTISVKDYSREYDGTTSASGAELQVASGTLYAGDSMSGGNKTFDTKGVGNGKTITVSEVTVSDSAGNANNYNISYAANTNSAITPKTLTVLFADISKTYDGTADAAAGAGTLDGVVAVDTGKVSVSASAAYADKNAGTNKQVDYTNVTLGGDEAGNYTIAAAATGTGVITPKAITATFADISKTYDGTTNATAGAGTLVGVEAVDTGKVSVTASAAYADKNAGTNKQVDYTNVALTGTESGNYTIAGTATGKGQIDRANLTISVKDYSREYDGTVNADGAELSVTSGTLYVGDTISGGTKVFDTRDVGTGKTITISGVSINDGNNGDNYAVTYQPNTNSAITALPQSEPENPQPSQPEPGKPEPVNPEPSNPEPSNPEPVNPEPSNPEPSNPEPVNTDPSQEQQLAETGNAVADIESATEKLGAEEVNEMKEKMAAPKHEALEVTNEKSGDDENEKKQSKK